MSSTEVLSSSLAGPGLSHEDGSRSCTSDGYVSLKEENGAGRANPRLLQKETAPSSLRNCPGVERPPTAPAPSCTMKETREASLLSATLNEEAIPAADAVSNKSQGRMPEALGSGTSAFSVCSFPCRTTTLSSGVDPMTRFVWRFLNSLDGQTLVSQVRHPLQLVLCLLFVYEKAKEESDFLAPSSRGSSPDALRGYGPQPRFIRKTYRLPSAAAADRLNFEATENEEAKETAGGNVSTKAEKTGSSVAKCAGLPARTSQVQPEGVVVSSRTFRGLADDLQTDRSVTFSVERRERKAEVSGYAERERRGMESRDPDEVSGQTHPVPVNAEKERGGGGEGHGTGAQRDSEDLKIDREKDDGEDGPSSKSEEELAVASDQERYAYERTEQLLPSGGLDAASSLPLDLPSSVSTEVLRYWMKWNNRLENVAVTVGAECRYGAYFEGQEKEAALRRGTVDARIPSDVQYTRYVLAKI